MNALFRRYQEGGSIQSEEIPIDNGPNSRKPDELFILDSEEDDEDYDPNGNNTRESQRDMNDTSYEDNLEGTGAPDVDSGTDDEDLSEELSNYGEELTGDELDEIENMIDLRQQSAPKNKNDLFSGSYEYNAASDEDYSESEESLWSDALGETNVEDLTVLLSGQEKRFKKDNKRRRPKDTNERARSYDASGKSAKSEFFVSLVSSRSVQIAAVFLAALFFVIAPRISTLTGGLSTDFELGTPHPSSLQRKLVDLSRKQDVLAATLEHQSTSIATQLERIGSMFDDLDAKFASQPWTSLRLELDLLKNNMRQPDTSDHKLQQLDDKLRRITEMYDSFELAKQLVVADFVKILPEKVPAYIEDSKIHFSPEFHRYLLAFVDKYHQQRNNQSVDSLLETHRAQLNSYIAGAIRSYNLVTRETVEKIVEQLLEESNQVIWERFNGLVDTVLMNSSNVNVAADGVMLKSLLDVFSKSTRSVNYADYQLGARVLGFLTSGGTGSDKLIARRVFLGWYDYFKGPLSPTTWKYNANRALVENDNAWSCGSYCSLGIRLFDAVLPTDLVLHSSGVTGISIYIKPKLALQVDAVQRYTSRLKFTHEDMESKYARKFIKIQETTVIGNVNHILLPQSLMNIQVPVRDLIVEIYGENASVESIRVHGVKESGARDLKQGFQAVNQEVYLGEDVEV